MKRPAYVEVSGVLTEVFERGRQDRDGRVVGALHGACSQPGLRKASDKGRGLERSRIVWET